MTEVQQLYYKFLELREEARVAKDLGCYPTSQDPAIAQFSFCNINREHDRVTRWVDANVRKAGFGLNVTVHLLTIARVFNDPEPLTEALALDRWADLPKTMHARLKAGKRVFRGAYMMPSHGSKEQLAMSPIDYYCEAIEAVRKTDFHNCYTLEQVADKILAIHGFGPFLANQIVTDLRYTPHFDKAEDWETFVLGGPGTSRGLCRFHGEPLSIGKSQKWIRPRLFEVRQRILDNLLHINVSQHQLNIAEYFQDPNNISNSFCEFDKYMRFTEGGKLRRLYKPSTK